MKSTTVITGPSGSGKPLIGEIFVTAWLKKAGSVVFMSLQYPGPEFITESIKSVTGLDINNYKEINKYLGTLEANNKIVTVKLERGVFYEIKHK